MEAVTSEDLKRANPFLEDKDIKSILRYYNQLNLGKQEVQNKMISKGTVQAVSNKGGRYGVRVGDTWYNGSNDCPVNKGDEVEVEFEVNGNFKNVKEIKTTSTAPKTEVKFEESNKLKQASVMISYAKDLAVAERIQTEEISKFAKSFINLQEELVKLMDKKEEIPTIKPEDL